LPANIFDKLEDYRNKVSKETFRLVNEGKKREKLSIDRIND
jgi:hypothetical protein